MKYSYIKHEMYRRNEVSFGNVEGIKSYLGKVFAFKFLDRAQKVFAIFYTAKTDTTI
jgi:hypothetical protein